MNPAAAPVIKPGAVLPPARQVLSGRPARWRQAGVPHGSAGAEGAAAAVAAEAGVDRLVTCRTGAGATALAARVTGLGAGLTACLGVSRGADWAARDFWKAVSLSARSSAHCIDPRNDVRATPTPLCQSVRRQRVREATPPVARPLLRSSAIHRC